MENIPNSTLCWSQCLLNDYQVHKNGCIFNKWMQHFIHENGLQIGRWQWFVIWSHLKWTKEDSLALHRITTLSDRCNRPPLAFASVSPKSAPAQFLSSWHKASLHLLQNRHLLTDRTTKPAMYNYYILYVQWQVTHTSIVQTVAMGNWMSTLPVRRLSLPLCRQVVVARSEKRWSVCPLTAHLCWVYWF